MNFYARVMIMMTAFLAGSAGAQDDYQKFRKMAEHFARCAGVFSAVASTEQKHGAPAQAEESRGQARGALAAAAFLVNPIFGENALEWAENRSRSMEDHYLADLERNPKMSYHFRSSFMLCLDSLDIQEDILNQMRDQIYAR